MDNVEDWISRLSAHMKRRKITQQMLAARLGMTYQGVNHWFNGRRSPDTLDQFQRIAQAAECSPAWMLYGIGPEEPITQEDLMLVQLIKQLPPAAKSAAEALLRSLADRNAGDHPKTGTKS